MWRLLTFALALLVAHVGAFSSTPARTDARDPPVPDPPPLRSAPLLGADANFEPDIDSDGDGVLSFREAYEYGRLLPCNNYTEYQVHLWLTFSANDADGDGTYTKVEAREHFQSLPDEVQEGMAGCVGHTGNGRRLSDADTVLFSPAFAATVKPTPIPVPTPHPEFEDNYNSYESTRLGLDVLFKCFEYGRCPSGVTPDDMDDFLNNVLTHFKRQQSIAQLTEQVSNGAVQAVKDEADKRNADLKTNSETVAGLNLASGVAGTASIFFRGAPGVGLFLTGSTIGTMVAAQVVGLKQKELQEGVIEYITGFQKKVVDRPEMDSIREWSIAGSNMGAFFPRLLIATTFESMWALFGAIPVATQAAMTDSSLQPYMYDWKQGDFYCPDPCTYPYDHLTVDAMKTYIKLMAAPAATLQYSGEAEKLKQYMLELANATVGEFDQVPLGELTTLNTKYFGEMGPQLVQIGQGLLGLYTVPVFFKSAYQLRPSAVWKWWKAGAPIYDSGFTRRYIPPASKLIGLETSRMAGFPSASQLNRVDNYLVRKVVYDIQDRGESMMIAATNGKGSIVNGAQYSRGLDLKTQAREMLNNRPGQTSRAVDPRAWKPHQQRLFQSQLHDNTPSSLRTKKGIADQLDKSPAKKSRLAAIGKSSAVGKWTRFGYRLAKGLVVLVAVFIAVLEVFAIIAAHQVYDEYAEAIGKTAADVAQYYREVISAYSEQEAAPEEPEEEPEEA